MLNSVKTKILGYFIQIGLGEQGDLEVYEYGFILLLKKLFHIVTILAMGWLANELVNVAIFLLVYICIREYSGGYHSKSSLGCYICTVVIISLAIAFFKLELFHPWIVLLILVICGVLIWFFSPQEAENKPLEFGEIQRYRKRTRIYLITFEIIALILHILLPTLEKGIVCALLIQSIMLLISIVKMVNN